MTRRLRSALASSRPVLAGGSDLSACGDKSLAAGGIRMQRALAARYPACGLDLHAERLSPERCRARARSAEDAALVGHTYREVATADRSAGPGRQRSVQHPACRFRRCRRVAGEIRIVRVAPW